MKYMRDLVIILVSVATIFNYYSLTNYPEPITITVDIIQPTNLTHWRNREELEDFLREDDTDNLVYGESFNCLDFAYRLSYVAEQNGKIIVVLWDAWRNNITVQHAYNMAYSISDSTYYVIEPQSDEIVFWWRRQH